ncbi:MAG TPA: pentapeptide repeat-containing protein [Steroidobacteraceae bacterium]|nr:pentapeptide repeat-containing protein [Steroidobacteraceae bacterium]
MTWCESGGSGERAMLLLHGLGATAAVWNGVRQAIEQLARGVVQGGEGWRLEGRVALARALQRFPPLQLSATPVRGRPAIPWIHVVTGEGQLMISTLQALRSCLALLTVLASTACWAESLTREQIEQQLAAGRKDFANLEAPGVSLARMDFSGGSLFGANLKGADLSNARLARCNLNVAILREAVLVNADLREATLFSSVVVRADLSGADLSNAQLMGNFERAKLEGANLTHVRGGADMRNQPMGLVRLVLVGARMHGARLAQADLSRADLSYADLTRADLSGVNLTRAKLIGADLTGATLTDATLDGAEIHDAIFKGAVGIPTVRGLETAEGRESATFDR